MLTSWDFCHRNQVRMALLLDPDQSKSIHHLTAIVPPPRLRIYRHFTLIPHHSVPRHFYPPNGATPIPIQAPYTTLHVPRG